MNNSGNTIEVGAVGGRLGARAAHLLGIAGNVADNRIELGDGDREPVGTGVHKSVWIGCTLIPAKRKPFWFCVDRFLRRTGSRFAKMI